MQKFAIAALTAIIATVSLSSVAEAGRRWRHHGGWHHRHWRPVVVVSPRVVYNDYCFVKKVKRYDDWGNVYIKRVRVCG
jgi:hypothetical protein